MVVACPACHTRYRVNGSVTLAGETSFECSQEECKHIFVYNPPVLWKGNTSSDIDPPADPPIPDSPSQQEPASQNEAKQSPQAEASRPEPAPDSRQDVLRDSVPAAAADVPSWKTPQSQREVERSFALQPSVSMAPSCQEEEDEEPRLKFAYRDQDEQDEQDEQGAEQQYEQEDAQYEQGEMQEYEREEAFLPLRTVFLLLVGCVLGYAALSYYALSDLQETKLILRNLPFVGDVLVAESFSESHITLTNLSGSFWLSKDNRRVFAVAGTAVNNASSPARLVQIEGTLYNQVGKKVGQEIVFCGNEANSNLLQGLTVRDIETLQNLAPPKDFRIPAGQEVNCLLVFTKPPATVAELGGRVVSVQFGEPHGPLASVQLEEVEARSERPPQL